MDVLYSFAYEYAHLFISLDLIVCVSTTLSQLQFHHVTSWSCKITFHEISLTCLLVINLAMRLKYHLWSLPVISSLLWKLCRYFVFIIFHLFNQTSSHVLEYVICSHLCVLTLIPGVKIDWAHELLIDVYCF